MQYIVAKGSAVTSRVSLPILHIRAEFGAYSRDSSRFPRRRPFIYTGIRDRASPEFTGSRNYVPMAFTFRESASTGPVVLTVVLVTAAAFLFTCHHGPFFLRLFLLTPTIGMYLVVDMTYTAAGTFNMPTSYQ